MSKLQIEWADKDICEFLKFDYWTLEEALALLAGLDPDIANMKWGKNLKARNRIDAGIFLSDPNWNADQLEREYQAADKRIAKYFRILDRATPKWKADYKKENKAPYVWIDWANGHDLEVSSWVEWAAEHDLIDRPSNHKHVQANTAHVSLRTQPATVTLAGTGVKAEAGELGKSSVHSEVIERVGARAERTRHRIIAAVWDLLKESDDDRYLSDRDIQGELLQMYGKSEGEIAKAEGFSRRTLQKAVDEGRKLLDEDEKKTNLRNKSENQKE